jgi:hypothetical protein
MIAYNQIGTLGCNRKRFGHLWFDRHLRRYVLDGWELHCGDVFEVLDEGVWYSVRIEHANDGFFLIGLAAGRPVHNLEGMEARSCQ